MDGLPDAPVDLEIKQALAGYERGETVTDKEEEQSALLVSPWILSSLTATVR
jgi:hypothetical protein